MIYSLLSIGPKTNDDLFLMPKPIRETRMH